MNIVKAGFYGDHSSTFAMGGYNDYGPAAPPGHSTKGASAKKSNMGKARASSPSGVAHVEVCHFSRQDQRVTRL
jgi:hypothetical protein